MAKIGVVVGSLSKESINRKYAKALVKLAGNKHSFGFIEINKLPVHNRDLAENPPAEVTRFKEDAKQYDAYLIVTPEYNRSIPAELKNAIDWGSKPQGTSVWPKPTVIAGASIGAIGTAAAQQHLRSVMGTLGALVMPSDLYFTLKPGMIEDDGTITVEDTKVFLQKFADKINAFYDKQA